MGYSSSVTVDNLGAGRYRVVIAELEAGAATEATISGIPTEARLLKQVCSLVSGTGATVDPIIGTATNPSGVDVVAENETAAANINNIAAPPNPFSSVTGTLYHRSQCDAGSDNTVQSVYLFESNWS